MKKFISILGTGNYSTTKYFWKDKTNYVETNFSQKATLDLICTDFQEHDQCLIFVTSKSYETNWIEHPKEREYIGLKGILKNYPFEVKCKDIPEGNNEEEIWSIFQTIYDLINENDELYVDITHSFRSLPMLLLVLLNYLKVLKNVSVRSLTYGNWEGRDKDNFSPIIDLLPLIELQNWTIAANNFIQYGNAKMLVELTKKEIHPILRETQGRNETASVLRSLSEKLLRFSLSLSTVRGNVIYEKNEPGEIKDLLIKARNSNNLIIQLNPILKKIEEKISDFSDDPIKRLYRSAKWCFDHEMYQQAYSFLLEGFITEVCQKFELDVHNISHRSLVTSIMKIVNEDLPEDKWSEDCKQNSEIVKQMIKWFKENTHKEMLKTLSSIHELRNDIMHAGFRQQATNSDRLIRTLGDFFVKYASQLL